MAKDQIPELKTVQNTGPMTLDGAGQMVADLVQLIGAKALAHRLAFKVLIQELSATIGPETAFRVQARLDGIWWDPAMLGGEHNGPRELVAQEIASFVEELDDLIKGPRRTGKGDSRPPMPAHNAGPGHNRSAGLPTKRRSRCYLISPGAAPAMEA